MPHYVQNTFKNDLKMATNTCFSTEIADFEVQFFKLKSSFFTLSVLKYRFYEIKNNYIKSKTLSMYVAFVIVSNVCLRCI